MYIINYINKNDYKSQKQKIKTKQQAFSAQEQLIIQKQNQIDDITKNLTEIKRNLDQKDEELKNSTKYIESLKNNINETYKNTEEQEKVIRFLNQKVNDSYTPYKTLFKKDFESFEIRKGNPMFSTNCEDLKTNNFSTQGYMTNNNLKENFNNTNNNNLNNNNVFNSDNSYKPYFNSNAFQTQGSLNEKDKNFDGKIFYFIFKR